MPVLSRCGKSGTAFAQDKMGAMGKVFLALAVLIILVIVGLALVCAEVAWGWNRSGRYRTSA